MRPRPLLTPVMSQFLWGMCRLSLRLWAGWSETFAHHLLAPGPERFGALRIEGVGPNPRAHRTDQPVRDLRHLAVLAVEAADLFGRSDEGRPRPKSRLPGGSS